MINEEYELFHTNVVIEREYDDDELAHFGILGQKWGIRRFQNRDGSLTTEGKKRRGQSEESSKEKSYKDMSDDELRKATQRLESEKYYLQTKNDVTKEKNYAEKAEKYEKEKNRSKLSKFNEKIVNEVLVPVAIEQSKNALNKVAGKAIDKYTKDLFKTDQEKELAKEMAINELYKLKTQTVGYKAFLASYNNSSISAKDISKSTATAKQSSKVVGNEAADKAANETEENITRNPYERKTKFEERKQNEINNASENARKEAVQEHETFKKDYDIIEKAINMGLRNSQQNGKGKNNKKR